MEKIESGNAVIVDRSYEYVYLIGVHIAKSSFLHFSSLSVDLSR